MLTYIELAPNLEPMSASFRLKNMKPNESFFAQRKSKFQKPKAHNKSVAISPATASLNVSPRDRITNSITIKNK
jgi:hypothetical protein